MQYLRDNDGTLEASADGTNWEVVALGEGGGGVSDHTLLTNIGTTEHAQIDMHIEDTDIHGETIANPVNLGSLQLRDNAGALEVSADNATTWQPVGGGGGGTAFQVVFKDAPSPYELTLADCTGKTFFANSGLVILPATNTIQADEAAVIRIFCRTSPSDTTTITPPSDEYITLRTIGGADGEDIVLTSGSSCLLYGWDQAWFVVDAHGSCEFAT